MYHCCVLAAVAKSRSTKTRDILLVIVFVKISKQPNVSMNSDFEGLPKAASEDSCKYHTSELQKDIWVIKCEENPMARIYNEAKNRAEQRKCRSKRRP